MLSTKIKEVIKDHAGQLSVRIGVERRTEECERILTNALLILLDETKSIRYVYEDLHYSMKSESSMNSDAFYEAYEQFLLMWSDLRKLAPAKVLQKERQALHSNKEGVSYKGSVHVSYHEVVASKNIKTYPGYLMVDGNKIPKEVVVAVAGNTVIYQASLNLGELVHHAKSLDGKDTYKTKYYDLKVYKNTSVSIK